MAKNSRRITTIIVLAAISFLPAFAIIRARVDSLTPRRGGMWRLNCLNQIGKALSVYARDNDNWLPPTLWTLYPDFIDTPSILAAETPGKYSADEYFGRYHYLYEGSAPSVQTAGFTVDTPVAFYPFRTKDDGEGFYVLFGDGHVSFQSDLTFLSGQLAKGDDR